MRKTVSKPAWVWCASFATLAVSTALSAPANAQNRPATDAAAASGPVTPDQAPPADQAGTIVVTGSRIQSSGFTAPTPVTVLGEEQIARQGTTNIAQVLNEIPAFRPQSTPATTAIFVSNLGASTADLRGLGGNRTLVLIDGRRVVGSTVAGGSFTPANTVDLNLVPTTLLQRVDVVTGGASAAYGSDAVAGVVNLIINRNLEGIRSTIQYGQTEQGDNEEFLFGLAFGQHFAGDRGRFVLGTEYVDNQGTGDCYTRDWCSQGYNLISNPLAAGSTTRRVLAGQPANLLLPFSTTATASVNGLVVAGPLRGLEFRPGGGTATHDYGTYYGAGLFQSGGGDGKSAFYQFFPLSAPSKRANIFANVDFDVTDSLKLFAQGAYGHVEGTILGASRRDITPGGTYQIARDNAFLPQSVVSQMIQAGVQTLPFGRIWNDIGPQIGTVSRDTLRAVAGFDWKPTSRLTLEGYYQFGRTNYGQRGYNTTINARVARAIDAVRNGAGQVVCRVNADANPANDDPACVPLNPFGAGSFSQDAKSYVTGIVMQDATITQHVASLTLSGDLLDLWAGPLSFAAGGEYRRDEVTSIIDPISAANGFYTSPGGGITGTTRGLDVKEGFVEVALPLAKDLPFARELGVNGAVRVTDYSTTGQVTTWKAGAEWAPVDWLRFRGTRSRDIRAPNLFELYGAPQSSFQTVDDPANGGVRGLFPTLLSGNANLKPEIADTWTAGAVFTGRFGNAGTLRLSADWYDISLKGAISTLGAQILVTRCFQGSTDLCQYVTRNSANQLTQIVNPNLNLNTLITRGWDLEGSYNLPLSNVIAGSKASLDFRVLATIVKDLITVDTTGAAIDRAGQNGSGVSQPSGLPNYTINGFITYNSDPFSLQLQVRHISSGLFQVTNIGPDQAGYDPLLANSINDNSVGAVTYLNLNAQYTLWHDGDRKAELFGVVNNLADRDPPKDIPSSFGPTNPVLYDVLGRSYKIGVRISY